MKLHQTILEAKHKRQVTISPAEGIYGKVKLDVDFHFSAGGSSRHGDNASYDEQHDDEFELGKITLAHDVDETDDDDGKTVVKTWPKGTDARKLTHWSDDDEELVEKAILKLRD